MPSGAKLRRSSSVTPSTPVAPSPGRAKRFRDCRQQVAQRRAYNVGRLGMSGNGLAQKPDPVAEVARFVVVDPRVTLHESGQQPFPVEVPGCELEGRQPEGCLEP